MGHSRIEECAPSSPWWGESRSRYHHAARFAVGKVVLDATGGAEDRSEILLDAGAAAVVSVVPRIPQSRTVIDRHWAIMTARNALPLSDGRFDLAVMFGEISSGSSLAECLDELARVVASDGTALVSVPNRLFSHPRNPGVPEGYSGLRISPDELLATAQRYYDHVDIAGQRVSARYGSHPYWSHPGSTSDVPSESAKVGTRFASVRGPFWLLDRLSRLRFNRPAYPGEYDFEFTADAKEPPHALLAICTHPRYD